MPTTLTVNLTYFKSSGKYYDQGSYEVDASVYLHQIWDQVKKLRDTGRLPGLHDGASNYNILINVPGHPAEHPYFLMQ